MNLNLVVYGERLKKNLNHSVVLVYSFRTIRVSLNDMLKYRDRNLNIKLINFER